MRLILLLSVLCCGIIAGAPVMAAPMETIAVVVNEDAITKSDVEDRTSLIIASSGLPNTPDIRQKLLPQIIGALVDEHIMLQEARRLELDVTPAEVSEGFATVANQNNIPPEKFREMIKQSGINIATMEDQIKSQIAWSKVVQKKLHAQAVVSESDIDAQLARLQSQIGNTEYLVSEIFLPIETPEQATQVQQLASGLVQEIRSGKAPFFKVAQQFSKAAGSPQGGDLGWVQNGQLAPELNEALPNIEVGTVSAPIRTISGLHILTVRERRSISADTLPSRDQIANTLGMARLDRLQRRHLQDLRAAAFIDNRLGS